MSQKGQIYKRIFPRNRGYCVYYCVYQHPWITPLVLAGKLSVMRCI